MFKFRFKQNYSTMVLIPYTHTPCPPKGISTNSGTILKICKISKKGIIFDMKLDQNNMKYMFLKLGSNNFFPLWISYLGNTLFVPQRHHYQFWTNFENMQNYLKKLGIIFDMKHNRNNLKHMFLNSASNKNIPL